MYTSKERNITNHTKNGHKRSDSIDLGVFSSKKRHSHNSTAPNYMWCENKLQNECKFANIDLDVIDRELEMFNKILKSEKSSSQTIPRSFEHTETLSWSDFLDMDLKQSNGDIFELDINVKPLGETDKFKRSPRHKKGRIFSFFHRSNSNK